jgi:hypothetical protein
MSPTMSSAAASGGPHSPYEGSQRPHVKVIQRACLASSSSLRGVTTTRPACLACRGPRPHCLCEGSQRDGLDCAGHVRGTRILVAPTKGHSASTSPAEAARSPSLHRTYQGSQHEVVPVEDRDLDVLIVPARGQNSPPCTARRSGRMPLLPLRGVATTVSRSRSRIEVVTRSC